MVQLHGPQPIKDNMLDTKVNNIVIYDYIMNCHPAYDELSKILEDLQDWANNHKVSLNEEVEYLWNNKEWQARLQKVLELARKDYEHLFKDDFIKINFSSLDKEVIQQAIKEIDRFVCKVEGIKRQAVVKGYYRNGKFVRGYTRKY